MPRKLVPSALLIALALSPIRRASADVGDNEADYDPGKAARRSEVAIGLLLGGAAGNVSGYPNSIEKIDVPEYERTTGFGGGLAGGLWLGGALRDWFVFGVGLSQFSVSGNGLTSKGTVYLAHIEAYPLFAQGGVFRDLGLVAEFGAGSRSVQRSGEDVASGGVMSIVDFGVVYEPLRLGPHFSMGPSLMVSHQFSLSLSATLAIAGLRMVYYGGPG